jgi:hypothetical protein
MDMNEWDDTWKKIQKDIGELYTNGQILEHWKSGIPENASLRGGWPSKAHTPHIKHLGYRKNSKAGHERAGEKELEAKLLGERGKVKIHYVEKDNEPLRLQVCFHNMGLGTSRASQKIIDCFGVINVGNKNYPAAIEVKKDNEGPWHAVIENLIQVQMLRENRENLQKYFGDPPLSFGTLSDAWGVVLGPKNYFISKTKEKSFKRASDLIEHIRDEVKLTLVACDEEPAGVEKAFAESNALKDTYWRLSHVGGYWPSRTETLKLS